MCSINIVSKNTKNNTINIHYGPALKKYLYCTSHGGGSSSAGSSMFTITMCSCVEVCFHLPLSECYSGETQKHTKVLHLLLSFCTYAYQTERPIPKIFGTNTWTVILLSTVISDITGTYKKKKEQILKDESK